MGKGELNNQSRQAFYRQYRSTSFDEVVGQEHITDLLKESVASGNFSHAYLFTGQKGTGKTSVARILAYAINNIPYEVDSQHLDVIEIDAASNRRIDDIRDLREKVHIAPVSAPYKVYIIDEVHMLTGESFNALLKTLEEPPAHVVFILATTELHKVPATIVSRTQRFHFRAVPLAKVSDHLTNIAQKEGIKIDKPAIKIIAEHGEGSFRDSIGLLDQMASLDADITADLVETVLGKANSKQIDQLASWIKAKNSSEVRKSLQNFSNNGISASVISQQLTQILLNDDDTRMIEIAEDLMNIPRAQFPQLLLLSTLLRHSIEPTQPADEPKIAPVQDTAHAPKPPTEPLEAPQSISQPPKQASKPQPSTPKTESFTPEEPLESSPEKPAKTQEFNWDKLLDEIKSKNAPLYSVLARANAAFDQNRLTLYFKYALHRKKMQQPIYKTQLARHITEAFGTAPEVVVAENEAPIADAKTKLVADIMGGGEVVAI